MGYPSGFLLLFCFCLPSCCSSGVGWAAAFSLVFSVLIGYPPSVAWLREVLPCFSRACRLALVGLRCLWVPRSCGVQGLRDGSPVSGRDSVLPPSTIVTMTFPPFGGFGYGPSCWGSPSSDRGCVLWPAIVPEAIPPSSRFGPAPSPWVPLVWVRVVWGLQPFAWDGTLPPLLLFFPSGCGCPLGHVCLFVALDHERRITLVVVSYRCCHPSLGYSRRIPTPSFGSSAFLLLVAALLSYLSFLLFDCGLSSPGLICCYAMSLWYVDLLSCGCAATVSLATGFVAIFPALPSPACSGCAGSCGVSSPIGFATFAMGSPLRGRGWWVLDRNEGLVCFSFPSGLILRDVVTLWVETVFDLILDRNEEFSKSLLGWFRAFMVVSPFRGASWR